MNLNQLKVFYLTAKHGSLSAAAESLYITQPAVTKGIQRLHPPGIVQQRGCQDRRGGGTTLRVVSKEIGMGSLKAIPLSDPAMTRKFYLIHHKDKYISRSLQSLIDMVDQWVEEYRLGLH